MSGPLLAGLVWMHRPVPRFLMWKGPVAACAGAANASDSTAVARLATSSARVLRRFSMFLLVDAIDALRSRSSDGAGTFRSVPSPSPNLHGAAETTLTTT